MRSAIAMSRQTVESPSDGKKISPRESEDLQELSAGSDDSEELPDPTAGNYRRPRSAVKKPRQRKSATSGNFAERLTAREKGTSVRSRTLAADERALRPRRRAGPGATRVRAAA